MAVTSVNPKKRARKGGTGKWGKQCHRDRFPLMRSIRYERSMAAGKRGRQASDGNALSLNVSNGGMCLLMDRKPAITDVFRLHMPVFDRVAAMPTLGEVCWVQPLPFHQNGTCFVGVKFLL